MMKFMGYLLLFLIAAIAGTVGDYGHVLSGTDGYPPYDWRVPLLGVPYWVPLLFGSAGIVIGAAHVRSDRWLRRSAARRNPSTRSIIGGLSAFFALYLASGFIPLSTGGGRDSVIALISLMIWYFCDKTAAGLLQAGLTAAVGTCFEILLVRKGVFYYLAPSINLAGVPSWLPWLYLAAGVSVGNLGRKLNPEKTAQSAASGAANTF